MPTPAIGPLVRYRIILLRQTGPGVILVLLYGALVLAGQSSTAHAQGPLEKALGVPDRLPLKGEVRAHIEVIDGQFRP